MSADLLIHDILKGLASFFNLPKQGICIKNSSFQIKVLKIIILVSVKKGKKCYMLMAPLQKTSIPRSTHTVQHEQYTNSLTLVIILPLGSGCPGPGVGVSVSLIAATAATGGQPRGSESSRATLPVILGAAGCAPQRERRPGARLLQCPA